MSKNSDGMRSIVGRSFCEELAFHLISIGTVTNIPFNISEVTFAYDIKFPIWFGPFTHLGFPGLTGFDGQTVSSIPYVSDLVLECTFQDDVLMDSFAGPDMVGAGAHANSISSCSPLGKNCKKKSGAKR
jgi:hypothetical protein